ncbi:MAG: glycosyltransferase [Aureibaculum sp.]|nr:glycosyltransferase [Aureibaculum sp.]
MPYPPNYGGVIDVFYKLKALHELGIEIYLHAFEYGRGKPEELDQICKQVFYYERNSSIVKVLSMTPYIVKSRSSDELTKNLKRIKAPILFEGLHTTYPLKNENFEDRKLLVRSHNIEHLYYEGLAKSESRIDKKIFFKIEAKKLSVYENILDKVDTILTISPSEHNYFRNRFIDKAAYIPVFHQNNKVKKLSKKGNFALYHGDLRVADNTKSVYFLMDIFKHLDYDLVIASSFKNHTIMNEIANYKHMRFVEIENQNHMLDLFEKAHINVLPTFQKTGIKLKLINTLFNGRFCVATTKMVEDTGLESLCEIGRTKEEFARKVVELINKDYTDIIVEEREKALKPFNTKINAQKIIDLLD